jgi:endoglucanase
MLQALVEAIGISGAEEEVRRLIIEAIQVHVDSWQIDSMGNLIAFKKGTAEGAMTCLIAAHMDEVGFMVTGHDSSGMLQVEAVGGIDAKILPTLRVLVGKKKLKGFFAWKPIHLSSSQEVVSISSLRVDIGTATKEAAASAAPLGTYVAFDSSYTELSADVLRAKAFDDRVGCAELIELLQGERLPVDLYAAFTVQEEVGLRGAKVVSARVQPDFAIVLEATACHEVPQDPNEPDVTPVTRLGQGPALSYKDKSSIAHPGLLRHFVQTAQAEAIPYQYRSAQFAGGNDAGTIHLAGRGVPTVAVSLPCRYLHSPLTMISRSDYRHAVALVRAALQTITPQTLER